MTSDLTDPGPFVQDDVQRGIDSTFASMLRRQSVFEAISGRIYPSFADIRVRLVLCPEDRAASERLIAVRYAERGYSISREAVTAAQGDSVLADQLVFLACRGARSVGTLSIGMNDGCNLLVDEVNRSVIAKLKLAGRRVVALGRLAVDDFENGRAVLAQLFCAAYRAGRLVHEATDVLIEVNPRHANFYARIFGFVRLSSQQTCSRVNAPAILMGLDVVEFGERLIHRDDRHDDGRHDLEQLGTARAPLSHKT